MLKLTSKKLTWIFTRNSETGKNKALWFILNKLHSRIEQYDLNTSQSELVFFYCSNKTIRIQAHHPQLHAKIKSLNLRKNILNSLQTMIFSLNRPLRIKNSLPHPMLLKSSFINEHHPLKFLGNLSILLLALALSKSIFGIIVIFAKRSRKCCK